MVANLLAATPRRCGNDQPSRRPQGLAPAWPIFDKVTKLFGLCNVGVMRWCLTLLLILAIEPCAKADVVEQSDLFALYCIGVLDASVRLRASATSACAPWETKELCADRATGVNQKNMDDAYRRARFESYLKVRVASSTERATMLGASGQAMRQIGAADLATCQEHRAAHWMRWGEDCRTVCEGNSRKSVDCSICFREQEPAVCASIERCNDPALLPH